MTSKSNQVECTIPVLPVSDLNRAIAFYTEQLGFALDWRSDRIGSVSRDGCHIMLSASDNAAAGVCFWMGLESETLFEEYRRRGVAVLQEPRNFSWAYEMKFADLDGNVLWLGTESRSDLPVADTRPN